MLIKEFKRELDKYNKKEIIEIASFLYKKIPKKLKEESEIDNYIIDINNKNVKSSEEELTMEDLQKKLDYFLECVDNGYYASPNRIIPKSARSKWRFQVKKYYKMLNKYPIDSSDGLIATYYLIQLFKKLSIGTGRLLFSSRNTFGAVGVNQTLFYENIVKRILYQVKNENNIKKCISLLYVPRDIDEFESFMYDVLISSLNTNEERQIAIKLLSENVDLNTNKMVKVKTYQDEYNLKTQINSDTYGIVSLYFDMGKIEEGLKYYHKHSIENNEEEKEYIILEILEIREEYEWWIKEYDSHKIVYRKSLKENYIKFKKLLENE